VGGVLGSIVIPAYNEGAVIERCLDEVFDGLDPSEVEVVVACNGCTDDTVDRARSSGYPVRVLDLPEAGKIGALNAGEDSLTALPRLYLDADVSINGRTVRNVLEATAGGAVAARPRITFDTSRSSRLVRRYYAARERLPGVMSELCTAGVYALSATARARFDHFPEVIADDLFAARIIRDDEVEIVDGDPVVVHVPRTAPALVAVLKRVYRGNRELADERPDLAAPTTSSTARDLLTLGRTRGHRLDALVYGAFALGARVAIAVDRNPVRWERDDTSRQSPVAGARDDRTA
jgi:glycosyltransferase involved in cell wall biosynthesis